MRLSGVQFRALLVVCLTGLVLVMTMVPSTDGYYRNYRRRRVNNRGAGHGVVQANRAVGGTQNNQNNSNNKQQNPGNTLINQIHVHVQQSSSEDCASGDKSACGAGSESTGGGSAASSGGGDDANYSKYNAHNSPDGAAGSSSGNNHQDDEDLLEKAKISASGLDYTAIGEILRKKRAKQIDQQQQNQHYPTETNAYQHHEAAQPIDCRSDSHHACPMLNGYMGNAIGGKISGSIGGVLFGGHAGGSIRGSIGGAIGGEHHEGGARIGAEIEGAFGGHRGGEYQAPGLHNQRLESSYERPVLPPMPHGWHVAVGNHYEHQANFAGEFEAGPASSRYTNGYHHRRPNEMAPASHNGHGSLGAHGEGQYRSHGHPSACIGCEKYHGNAPMHYGHGHYEWGAFEHDVLGGRHNYNMHGGATASAAMEADYHHYRQEAPHGQRMSYEQLQDDDLPSPPSSSHWNSR